jgi:hypothetical protein
MCVCTYHVCIHILNVFQRVLFFDSVEEKKVQQIQRMVIVMERDQLRWYSCATAFSLFYSITSL